MTPERLTEIRYRRVWSRCDVARMFKCTDGLVKRWEKGMVEIPWKVAAWLEAHESWLAANPPPDDWR
jgi:transcriptional regulator with XRE-family HTH domain